MIITFARKFGLGFIYPFGSLSLHTYSLHWQRTFSRKMWWSAASVYRYARHWLILTLHRNMATKVVYFTVDGKPEQAEFRSDDTADELKGKLLSRGKLYIYVHLSKWGRECARRMNTTVNAYFWFDFLLTVTCTS